MPMAKLCMYYTLIYKNKQKSAMPMAKPCID
jgi:hypothetical protein